LQRLLALAWLVVVCGSALLILVSFVPGLLSVPRLTGLPDQLSQAEVQSPTPDPSPPASAGGTSTPAARASGAPPSNCQAGHLAFTHGLADLKAVLGAPMGEPLECERVVDTDGSTEQATTTGLAYYRSATNTVAFTNGAEHWALSDTGLVHWTGDALQPPPDAEELPR
jgi:hypothetical protein